MDCWWIGTDNALRVSDLRDAITGQSVDDATVTAQLADSAGAVVSGAENIVLAAVEGSPGEYAGVLSAGLALQAGRVYTLTLTASGEGFQLTVKVRRRAAFKGP